MPSHWLVRVQQSWSDRPFEIEEFQFTGSDGERNAREFAKSTDRTVSEIVWVHDPEETARRVVTIQKGEN